MSERSDSAFDVFLCFPYEAHGLGDLVVMELDAAGLTSYRPWAADVSPDPRDVLADARAVVGVVLSGDKVDPTLTVAIGAANALGKPVYVVTDEVARPELPTYIAAQRVYPLSRLSELIAEISRSGRSGGNRRHRRVG